MANRLDCYALNGQRVILTSPSLCISYTGNSPKDAFGVMLSDEGNFAFKVIDGNIDMELFDTKFDLFVSNYKNRTEEVLKDLDLSPIERSEKLQEMMIGQLEFLGLSDKISLYQAALEEDFEGNQIIRWARKTLNEQKKVINNPC